MKFRTDLMFSAVCVTALWAAGNAFAAGGRLSPQDFNTMYHMAQNGRVWVLRDAVNRGLNIDAVNPNGDTGLCIAIKRKDHVAYNTFRMSGANPRHQCTYRIYKEYQEFLEAGKATNVNRVVGNEESLYYQEEKRSWWPWIIGGALLGGGALALSSGGGGGSDDDSTVIQDKPEYGLTGLIDDYYRLVSGSSAYNSLNLNGENPNAASVVNQIKLLPNVLNNEDYLRSYIRVVNGGSFTNMVGGRIGLGDAAIGMSAYNSGSVASNDGTVEIKAQNGTIGMAASNGAVVVNNPSGGIGKIDIAFTGGKEGDAVIGMYADTNSKATNYGVINGTTTKINSVTGEEDNAGDVQAGEDTSADRVTSANSGTILGMGAFDFYTGKDNNTSVVNVQNFGDINLSAGYNAATDVSVNLVGMGSYIDDAFLHGSSNPEFAEQMRLDNYGDITLKYAGQYNVSETALKFGDGGLIGMRADASTQAENRGNIDITLTSTQLTSNTDVAAGMLSVHGAELVNGNSESPYNGTGNTGGTIRFTNEANSGGVLYGMLVAKGDGTQTKIYKWKTPKAYNYGFIDLQTSNAYAMASFAGGEVVNNGVINLGKIPEESGGSFYKNNYGLYGSGGEDSPDVVLSNNGIINVYATESKAIYNAFAGAVVVENNGTIYLSTKATKSEAIGGNFSKAVNRGVIEYKVGGSEKAGIDGIVSKPGFSTSIPMENAVVVVGDAVNAKQLFENETTGKLIVGDVRQADKDYGGTYVTAGVQVKNQGTASNKGLIQLVKYDKDTPQVNAAMWLDDTTSNEAVIKNLGNIVVDATASIGMRNASQNGAEATNYGNIVVNGDYAYGMSVLDKARIFNGREISKPGDSVVSRAKTIDVNGFGAVGMYINGGVAYNYGDIYVNGQNATAVMLDGTEKEKESFFNYGNIYFSGREGQNLYWLANGANEDFSYPEGIIVDKYTFAKLTDGSAATFSGNAYVSGANSRLFVVEGGEVVNNGDVTVSSGATAIVAGGNDTTTDIKHMGMLTVGDETSEATGIYAVGDGTVVTLNSDVVVNKGTGVVATGGAEVTNLKDIRVKDGVGLDISGRGLSGTSSKGANDGTIVVAGDGTGVKLSYDAEFDNGGSISVVGNGTGVESGVDWENGGTISVSGTARGVEVVGGKFENAGTINLDSEGAYGIYNNGGSATNKGTIMGTGTAVYNASGVSSNEGTIDLVYGTGIAVAGGSASNSGEISVGNGVGMHVTGGKGTNSGKVSVGTGTGMLVDGGIASNSNSISVSSGKGMEILNGTGSNNGKIEVGNGYGMYVSGANAEAYNGASITITGTGTGMLVDGGEASNRGNISVSSGKGMEILNGTGNNNGEIEVGSGYGMYVNGENAKAYNNSSVTITGSGTGVQVENNGTFQNNGVITYDSRQGGSCGVDGSGCVDLKDEEEKKDNTGTGTETGGTGTGTEGGDTGGTEEVAQMMARAPVYVKANAKFINNGEVDFGSETVDFDEMRDETGSYVIAEDGNFKAESFKGKVLAGKDIVMHGFEDRYVKDNSFEGQNAGLNITSQSYLFDAKVEEKDGVLDVELNRKKFEEVVDEKDLAQFWETNYQLQHNEKMYNALKSAENESEFEGVQNVESGKNFYANLPRENMAVLRGLNTQEQNRILEDGLDGTSVGMDYYRTGKDAQGELSGYADNVFSPYVSYGQKLNRQWSVGGTLRAAYVDAEYDEANSSRDNKILLATLPILYQNGDFKFLTMPEMGVGFGTYKRHAVSDTYEGDTLDLYYGMYNHAEYSVDVKVAELVMEAELNLQGSSMSKVEEDEGLNLRSNNSLSLESGIGVKLRKRFALAKERSLMLALGVKYYHEFLDPYENLTVGMKGSPVNYRVNGYNENKDRIRTTAEAVYKDGDLSVAAEIAHNAEKESNIEGGLGVRYNF